MSAIPSADLIQNTRIFDSWLCKKLLDETTDRIAAVDFILWRAANLGIL